MEVAILDVHLHVDGKEIVLNQFVRKLLGGMIAGALTSLRNVEENWSEVKIVLVRSAG